MSPQSLSTTMLIRQIIRTFRRYWFRHCLLGIISLAPAIYIANDLPITPLAILTFFSPILLFVSMSFIEPACIHRTRLHDLKCGLGSASWWLCAIAIPFLNLPRKNMPDSSLMELSFFSMSVLGNELLPRFYQIKDWLSLAARFFGFYLLNQILATAILVAVHHPKHSVVQHLKNSFIQTIRNIIPICLIWLAVILFTVITINIVVLIAILPGRSPLMLLWPIYIVFIILPLWWQTFTQITKTLCQQTLS